MATTDIIRMSLKEARRLHIIQSAIGKKVKQVDAAKILEVTTRQIRRIVHRVREEGAEGIVHRSRGRPSNRKIPRETRDEVLRLYSKVPPDFGPTLASEKLLEKHRIKISDETLRLWLIAAQVPYPRRKARPHRQWRERKQYYGEMIQIDGSHHDWLEGRGPKIVLMGYIDDATGRVFGRFYPYEGTIPAFDSFRRYARKYGLAQSVYLDKHTTYRSPARPTIEDELNNRRPQSQFERAMDELGVTVIHANSPQAKGRIERLFRTFQDRLIKEMRLDNIATLSEANQFIKQYLPKYNRRFSVPAAKEEDLHRPVTSELDLNSILCIKKDRVVRNDFTVSYEGCLYQICEKIRARKVTVEEWTNGSIHIRHNGRNVSYKRIVKKPLKAVPEIRWHKSTAHKPDENHPWRRSGRLVLA